MRSGRIAGGFYRIAWFAILGLGLCAAQGCSGTKVEGDPNGRLVSGAVTYNGSPVKDANVTFTSPSGSAFGQTDAEGKFKLTTGSGEKVSLGEYRVSIVKKEPSAAPQTSFNPDQYVPPDPNAPPPAPPKDLLPAKYADAAKSGLTATVTADGKNEFEFPLSD